MTLHSNYPTNKLTPRNRVLLKKLTVAQVVNTFPPVMESEVRSQDPATFPYPVPDQASTLPPKGFI